MRVFYSFILNVCICCLAGTCVAEAQNDSQQKTPAWVNAPYSIFSENEYLLAVGSGSTQQEAQNNALANLSRIFKSNVETSQKLIDDFREYTQDNTFSSERSTQLLNITIVGSSQNLINTKILKLHHSGSIYYALAGIERLETASIYTSEIADNEMQINELMRLADQEDSKLYKLGYLRRALVLAEVNSTLSAQRSILRGGLLSADSQQQTLSRVKQAFDQMKQKTRVVIAYRGSVPKYVQAGVQNVFDESGFSVIGAGERDLYAIVTYTTSEVDLNRPNARFIRWQLSIAAENQKNEKKLPVFTAEGREGAFTTEEALLRAARAAKEEIETDFSKFIDQQILSN